MSDMHTQINLPKKRTILVVDDEQINREILGTALENDYRVLYAANGQEALKLLEKRSDVISLILLDLLMPVISGMMVLRQLRESPELARIPVIVMTSDHEAEVASLELGAFDFIPKPYPSRSVILARIRRIIELSEDRQIIRSTERDVLTGLYNREYFYNYIASFDKHHKGMDMDAIVVDINRFHIINERYGRAYADQLLRRLGNTLHALAQASGGMACRREADTFLVYRPHGGDDCAELFERLSATLADDEDTVNRVRLRMGVYPCADKSLEIEQRFDRACAAADTIRSNYTQNIAVYDDKLHEAELFAEQLTEDFNQAISEGQFKVYYQPKYDIRPDTPILASAEALIRWQHPRLGLVSPGVFIPLFEENGMIQRLDHFVWAQAAAQVRDWKQRYGLSIPISVNVSRVDMFDPQIAHTFEVLLKANDLAPTELIPEITESAYTDNEKLIISTVQTLRTLGLRVEMDDFGTGYSSLGMISHLPLDALKLDMTFVRNAFSGNGDTRMIELIIDIAEYLGVPTIAEGVETREQMEALRVMGCDFVQGYFFSKPVPPEEFERFIEEKARLLKGNPETGEQPQPWLADPTPMLRAGNRLTYTRLAQALAADYFSIYYVDTRTDRFTEFTSHNAYAGLGIEKEGEDFFNLSRRNILRVVYPDDQHAILDCFTKESILRTIRENGAFTLTYRLVLDGNPIYVSLKATALGGPDSGSIVVGINNVDTQMKHQQALEEAQEEQLTFARIAQALSQDYYSFYVVNTDTDEFVEYSSSAEYEQLHVEQNGVNFFEDCRRNVIRLVHPDDLKMALQAWDKNHLMAELQDGRTFNISYRLLFDGAENRIHCKVIRMRGDDAHFIVIGIRNADEK